MFLRKNNIDYRCDTKNATIKIFDFVYYEKTGNITINKYPFIYDYNYYQLYKLIKTSLLLILFSNNLAIFRN